MKRLLVGALAVGLTFFFAPDETFAQRGRGGGGGGIGNALRGMGGGGGAFRGGGGAFRGGGGSSFRGGSSFGRSSGGFSGFRGAIGGSARSGGFSGRSFAPSRSFSGGSSRPSFSRPSFSAPQLSRPSVSQGLGNRSGFTPSSRYSTARPNFSGSTRSNLGNIPNLGSRLSTPSSRPSLNSGNTLGNRLGIGGDRPSVINRPNTGSTPSLGNRGGIGDRVLGNNRLGLDRNRSALGANRSNLGTARDLTDRLNLGARGNLGERVQQLTRDGLGSRIGEARSDLLNRSRAGDRAIGDLRDRVGDLRGRAGDLTGRAGDRLNDLNRQFGNRGDWDRGRGDWNQRRGDWDRDGRWGWGRDHWRYGKWHSWYRNPWHYNHWYRGHSFAFWWNSPGWYHSHWSYGSNYWLPVGWGYGPICYTSGYYSYDNPFYVPAVGYAGTYLDYSQPIYLAQQTIVTDAAPAVQVGDETARLFNDAQDAFSRGDYRAALDRVNQALEQRPNDAALHEFRALVLFATGDYRAAAAAAHAILAVGPGWDWDTLRGLYPNVDTYTTQLRALEQYRRENPDSAEARFLLAYHYISCGHNEAAARELREVQRILPEDQLSAQLLRTVTMAEQGAEALPAQPAAGAPEEAIPQPPAEAQPAEETRPAAPIEPEMLVGSWKAIRGDDSFELVLTKENTFTWTFSGKGEPQVLKGTYTLANNILVLEQGEGQAMVGRVNADGQNAFNFKLIGGPRGDEGLTFQR